MRRGGFGIALLAIAAASGSGQTLVDADHLPQVQEAFRSRPLGRLRCEISSMRPVLDYALHFQTGYTIDVPLSEFHGAGHSVAVLLRVTPEGGQPVYLGKQENLPEIRDTTRAEAELTGRFVVGEGAYGVEVLARDDSGRACSGNWHVQAKLTGSERELRPAAPPGTVEELGHAPAHAVRAAREAERITLLLHAAPQNPRASKIEPETTGALLDSVSAVLSQLPARSIHLIVFNREKQIVLLDKEGFTAADLGEITASFDKIELATVDYRVLQNRERVEVLSDLVGKELESARQADAVILLGPRSGAPLEASLASGLRRTGGPQWFYLQYEANTGSRMPRFPGSGSIDATPGGMGRRGPPPLAPVPTGAPQPPDGVEQFIHRLKGEVFTIRSAHDLAEAIHRMTSEIRMTEARAELPPKVPAEHAVEAPPETAEVTPSTDEDPVEVLMRLRDQVLAHAAKVPNHICVEAIQRDRYEPVAGRLAKSCSALLEARRQSTPALRLHATDWLRLDVGLADSKEIYSWAGAARFEEIDIDELVPQGAIGTGPYAGMLLSIFQNRTPHFRFEGNATLDSRRLLEFGFTVPRDESHYQVKTRNKQWVITGYSGKLLVDPHTAELVRLFVSTDELPAETGSCEVDSVLDYSMVSLNGFDYLLPRDARQRFIGREGDEAENRISFASCREYRGESSISFGPAGTAEPDAAADVPLPALEAGQSIAIDLAQAVDLEHAAAGDRIEGRLGTLMREAPAGAKVEGRLMRVELQHSGAPERTVALRWETIEINGLKIPLTLKPDRRLPSTKVPPRGNLQRRGIEIELPRPGEEKYGVYHFPAIRRVMDSGYRTEWVTVEKASGARRGGPER